MRTRATAFLRRAASSWLLSLAWLVALLVLGVQAARAGEPEVRGAIEEAVAVHAIATAARLCGLITEYDLTRALNRMDRVHGGRLAKHDQETYLIVRGSDGFRNLVYAAALRRAQGGCQSELAAVWLDVHASLLMADVAAGDHLAVSGTGRAPQ